jgi:hypothetical protein
MDFAPGDEVGGVAGCRQPAANEDHGERSVGLSREKKKQRKDADNPRLSSAATLLASIPS